MDRRRRLALLAGVGAAMILAGVALATATAGGARPPPRPSPAAAGDGPALAVPGVLSRTAFDRAAGALGLSAEQRQAVAACYDQSLPALERLHARMRAGAARLARTPPDDPAYQRVVAGVSEAAADAAAEFVLQASQLRSQIHGVLSAEQRGWLMALEVAAAQDRETDPPRRGSGGGGGS